MSPSETVELTRRVRFCVNPGLPEDRWTADGRDNTFAGWPGMTGLGAFYELEIRCRGASDPLTGYLLNISAIDEHARRLALPVVHRAMRLDPLTEPAAILQAIVAAMDSSLFGLLASIRWHLTPYYSITMTVQQPERVLIAQQFEFAAAHRLHVPSLTDEENHAIFGRCNNPNSHGHNYRLEVAAFVPVEGNRLPFTASRLERIVNEHIIQCFDHKNLNMDVPEFGRVNPSVENIVRVCFQLIREPIANAGAELSHVTVWETEKTSCTYGRRL